MSGPFQLRDVGRKDRQHFGFAPTHVYSSRAKRTDHVTITGSSNSVQVFVPETLAGFVAIGLDLITFKRSTEFGAYLDFRSGNRASVEVLRQKLQYYSHIIMGDYQEQHVVRPPSHGLLLTLSPGVIYSVPRLMPSGILEFHADITNIIFADFSLDSGSGLKDDISLILSRILQLNRTADV